MKCKRCGSERIYKNGKRNGEQCYLCRECGHQFVRELGAHSNAEEHLAVVLHALGVPLSEIASTLNYHNSTITRWVHRYSDSDERMPIPRGQVTLDLEEVRKLALERKLKLKIVSGG